MAITINVIQEPPNAKVDIVFVHGLHGKQARWTTESGVFWPKNLLSGKASDARIMSSEYPATIDTLFDGEAKFSRVSTRLIRELMEHRKTEESKNRPIIFVAHCIGGVLLENALVREAQRDKKGLVSCVRGIILLGSPHFKDGPSGTAEKYFQYARHLGSEISNESVLGDKPEQPTPNESDIGGKLKHLVSIPQAFINIQETDGIKFEIESFYASEGTVIVDEALAKLTETSLPQSLGRTQLGLSQYEDENDDDFRDVLLTLTGWLSKFDQVPEKQNGSGDVANVTFSGSHNSGWQLGQNTAPLSGITWGNGR